MNSPTKTTQQCQNVADFEAIARERVEPGAFGYFAGGAGDEVTLAENIRAYQRVRLTPRVLVDVSSIDARVELLGLSLPSPIVLAPTAYHRLAHPEGEVATARAAGALGALMVVSTMATRTIEEVAEAASAPLWFQLYVHKNRDITRHFVERAEAAGYRAIVLTVDTPRLGRRERDARTGFTLPADMPPANFAMKYADHARPGTAGGEVTLRTQALAHLESSLTWDSLKEIRAMSKLPLLLKGVMAPEDARRAVAAGVDGLIVSNHGGRQLDGAEATITALPGVVAAVDGAMPVLVDGGIRRGVDVLKALALGARAVLIGRPYLWGLAADGEAGVRRVLELLNDELELAMALCGCPTLSAIERGMARVEG